MTVMGDVLRAFSELLATVEARARGLIEEADPRTATELLPEWGEWARIGEDCQDGGPVSAQDQRNAVARKESGVGGQNAFHFSRLAQDFGYQVEVEDFVEIEATVAEEAEAGDELVEDDGQFAVEVHAPVESPRFARAGISVAGDRLVEFGNELLTCVLDDVKPAHIVFLYVFDQTYVGYAPWSAVCPDPVDVTVDLPFPTVIIA